MKKSKINMGIIAAFVIIALFNQCRSANVNHESKVADTIKFSTVDVKLEDILSEPTNNIETDFAVSYTEETPKIR